jgi:AcrR family transcriptional regulator
MCQQESDMNPKTAPVSAGAKESADPAETAASTPCHKPRVRDRIFDTACALFYQQGIRDVGVEQISTEAGTNKMSFYRSFGSKDELIAAYLEEKAREFWCWWEETTQPHAGDPRRQIEALFDGLVRTPFNARGCALANASVELSGAGDHPALRVVQSKKREMRRRLQELASAAGAERAEELADALMLLIEGSYLSRMTLSAEGPAKHVALVARKLLDSYLR